MEALEKSRKSDKCPIQNIYIEEKAINKKTLKIYAV